MRLPERGVASAAFLVGFFIASSPRAFCAEPALSFDLGRTVECRDVTPPEFADERPGQRLVECTYRLSVYLEAGDIAEVDAVRVEITDVDRRLRVHSFAPSTLLESALAENIKWTRSTEHEHSFGASLGGELPAPLGEVVAHVTPTINGGAGAKEKITETQTRVAPRDVVIASGTIDHEHGVFFTLRRSPTTSLEGVHELEVRYLVPAHWRGDAVRVACRATGQQKILWMKQQKIWAETATAVALYQAGDDVARLAAERQVRQ